MGLTHVIIAPPLRPCADAGSLPCIRHLSLTSVDPVSREVGIRAAQLLLERMADPSGPQRTEVLTPRLVVRNSTAPAR